jgi:uncharacterized protein YukE
MRRSCPFLWPPPTTPTCNQVDALSSDVTLALKHAAVFMSEFVQRCPLFNSFISTLLPDLQTSTAADCTDVTSRHHQLNGDGQRHIAELSQIDERMASLSSRVNEQNGSLSSRIDDCVSRLVGIQSQFTQELRTQSESRQEIWYKVATLNESVFDLTGKVSKSSKVKNEVDELRKAITQLQLQSQRQS